MGEVKEPFISRSDGLRVEASLDLIDDLLKNRQKPYSDPEAEKALFSRAGRRLYFEHIPATKGVCLAVEFAEDDTLEGD